MVNKKTIKNAFVRFLYKPKTNRIYWEKIISVVVVVVGFFVFVFYNQKRLDRLELLRDSSPSYTIGVIYGVDKNVRGAPVVNYTYYAHGRKYTSWGKSFKVYGNVITKGGRYFVKYYSRDPSNCQMLFKCPVPEDIQQPPYGGWDTLPIPCNE